MQLFRNASLVNKRKTSDIFVYRTPIVCFPSPITPLIEIKEPFDLKKFGQKTLAKSLYTFFDELFYKVSNRPETLESRRYDAALAVEMGFALAERPASGGHEKEVLNVRLPVALSPSLSIQKESLVDLINSLVKIYSTWYEGKQLAADNSVNRTLFFDLKVFSSLSDKRLPIIHFSNAAIALENDLKWWQLLNKEEQ